MDLVLKIKKMIGILLTVCFILSVTIASVSAAPPDPKQAIQTNGKASPNYGFRNLPIPGDMSKWNNEKKKMDTEKNKWDRENRNWNDEKRRWDRDKDKNGKHKNDYMKWYGMFMQWMKQFNGWNNKYSNWYHNYNDHFKGNGNKGRW